MRASLAGLSIIGPGLRCWEEARLILRGEGDWNLKPTEIGPVDILHGNERRRVSPMVRLALGAANDACKDAGIDPATMPAIFSSAFGDGYVLDNILRSLNSSDRNVSPTMFHNSVHNATVGYWNIAVSCHLPATSVAGGDYSFGVGLLKALMEVNAEGRSVILVQCDCPLREPLSSNRPIDFAFAVGLVLAKPDGRKGMIIEVQLDVTSKSNSDTVTHDEFKGISAPAIWAFPLLRLFARREKGEVNIRITEETSLRVIVTP